MDIKIEYIPDLDKYRIWNERYVNYVHTRMEVVELIKKLCYRIKTILIRVKFSRNRKVQAIRTWNWKDWLKWQKK